jgi:FkbH-like protein
MAGAVDILPWLLPPPIEFRATIKELEGSREADVAAVRRLAATAMDTDQLRRFAKLARKLAEPLKESGLAPVKLGLVGSHTLDYLPDSLCGSALRHGLLLTTVSADYGQVVQSIFDPGSPLASRDLDAVLVSLDPLMLGLARVHLDDAAATAAVDAAIAQMQTLQKGIRNVLGATAVFQTIPAPPDPLFGALDARVPGTPRAMIDSFNRRLAQEVIGSGDVLVDIAFAAAQYGLERWHDPRCWHSAKLPFSLEVSPLHADHVCRVLASLKGKARKCLVLDLDNTLWGGVIGDDGLEGILLGQGNAIGEAFLAIQNLALDLRSRGVILAVCSKNDDANARLPFLEHHDMVLKETHIAAFFANWTDKPTNLREISRLLNIGTDALVFLDDNPAEREIVRREMPEVAVPEVGMDPALYPGLLARAGYFEAIAFATEDRQRADMYQMNAVRARAAASVSNLEEYLTSLCMVLTARPFDAQGRARIAQLINKSNQFNLTTRRYTEAEVADMEVNPQKFTLQLRLTDKFGDNGMISVIIFDKGPMEWSCDTWLMSCRVLGRKVEIAALEVIARAAAKAGASRLVGTYLPTLKNSLVAQHFENLGFVKTATLNGGATQWSLALADHAPEPLPLVVEDLTVDLKDSGTPASAGSATW